MSHVWDKFNPERCYALNFERYLEMVSVVSPHRRVVYRDVEETHCLVVDEDFTPRWVWYVPIDGGWS